MKKIFTYLIMAFATISQTQAQTVQASVGRTTTPNTISIWLKPDATNPAAIISSLQFNLAYDNNTYTGAPPTLTFSNNQFAAQGVNWIYNTPWTDPAYSNFTNFSILNSQAGYSANFQAGVETEVLRITVNTAPGAPAFNAEDLMLLTLPDGGSNVNGIYYLTGTFNSDGSNLYYNHSGTGNYSFKNVFSYTPDPNFGNPVGVDFSFSSFAGTPLNLQTISLTGICLNGNNILDWRSSIEEALIDHYEIEQQIIGNDFKTIEKFSSNVHSFEHNIMNNLDKIYRVKQVLSDGSVDYSNSVVLSCQPTLNNVLVFPNPFQNIVHVKTNKIHNMITVFSSTGQLVKEIESHQTDNVIDIGFLPEGIYLIKISNDDGVFTQQITKQN